MEKVNNELLKKVVRDYLMDTNCSNPLIIWGKKNTGKTEIIDGVIKEMKFCKIIKDVEMHSNHDPRGSKYLYVDYKDFYPFERYEKKRSYTSQTIDLIKKQNINLGSFNDEVDELFAYSKRFTCYRSINLTDNSSCPRVIIEATYTDEQADMTMMQSTNSQSDALAYLYVLTYEDWREWAEETKRINPFYLRFLEENQNMFSLPINNQDSVPSIHVWDRASTSFFNTIAINEYNGDVVEIFQELYSRLASTAYPAASAFRDWLEKTFGVKIS